jgi:transposase
MKIPKGGPVSAKEIITRRRQGRAGEKAALLAEVEAEGGKVRPVARLHGISDSVRYGWRAAIKAAAGEARSGANAESATPEAVAFVPLGVMGAAIEGASTAIPVPRVSPPLCPPGGDVTAGTIEILLPGGARICVYAFVNERVLSRVLRAMKGRI